jgi:hypothetical protein
MHKYSYINKDQKPQNKSKNSSYDVIIALVAFLALSMKSFSMVIITMKTKSTFISFLTLSALIFLSSLFA